MTSYVNVDTVPVWKKVYVLSGTKERDKRVIKKFIEDEFSAIDNLFAYFDKCIERGDAVPFQA